MKVLAVLLLGLLAVLSVFAEESAREKRQFYGPRYGGGFGGPYGGRGYGPGYGFGGPRIIEKTVIIRPGFGRK